MGWEGCCSNSTQPHSGGQCLSFHGTEVFTNRKEALAIAWAWYLASFPGSSPAFFVQYATKSWGGAWEQGYMIFTNWKRGTGDCVGMWEVQWLGCGEVNLAKDRPQTSSPPPQHDTLWTHVALGVTFPITASNRFLRYSSIPYSGKYSYGGNFRIIRMPCEHTKI